jgi:hypothetical protein
MVGIPGKSKGCHTCRKRKIKVSDLNLLARIHTDCPSATCRNLTVNGVYGVEGYVKATIEVRSF